MKRPARARSSSPGTNTYTGTTTVSAGTLSLAGGTLAGTLVVGSGGTLNFSLPSNAVNDTALPSITTGSVDLTGATIAMDLESTAPTLGVSDVITLISSNVTGTPTTTTATIGGYTFDLSVSGGALIATVTAVDTTAPTLSAGSATRTSDATATVGFTTDEAGTAYYLVKNSGDAAPSNTVVVSTGTSLGTVSAGPVSGQTVTLTAGAKDIYVVVVDAAGHQSAPLKIAAAAYAFGVNIGSFSGGSVSASTTTAASGATVTLTVTPDAGYTLASISVRQTASPNATVSLGGSGNTLTFTMPAYAVTVTATFSELPNPDRDAVEDAEWLIEHAGFTAPQSAAGTTTGVRIWLVDAINILIYSTCISVTINDVTVSGFTSVVAGTESQPAGTNGSFRFSVSLAKGGYNATATNSGVITATAWSP